MKSSSGGTCTQGNLKPPCDGTCTQESLYSLLLMVHALKVSIKLSFMTTVRAW